jgi:excisionase family DNA binding protein
VPRGLWFFPTVTSEAGPRICADVQECFAATQATKKMKKTEPEQVPLAHKFALTIDEACELASVGRTKLYLALRAGELRAKKRGTTTLILPAELRRWLADLPDWTGDGEAPPAEMDEAPPAPAPRKHRPLLVAAE